jgi:hypothetical protein
VWLAPRGLGHRKHSPRTRSLTIAFSSASIFNFSTPPFPTGVTINWHISCANPSEANSGSGYVQIDNYDATNDVNSIAKTVISKLASLPAEPIIAGVGGETVTIVIGDAFAFSLATDARKGHKHAGRLVVLAAGRRTVNRAGRYKVKLRLTAAGHRYVRSHRHHKRRVRLTLAVFVQRKGHAPGYFSRRITLIP